MVKLVPTSKRLALFPPSLAALSSVPPTPKAVLSNLAFNSKTTLVTAQEYRYICALLVTAPAVLAVVPPVVMERSLIGSSGMLEIGDPPVTPARFTGTQPDPLIPDAAAFEAACTNTSPVGGVPAGAPVRVSPSVAVGTLIQIESSPLPPTHNVLPDVLSNKGSVIVVT